MAQAGICVAIGDAGAPQPQYEVRVPSAVSADGISAFPVLALGPVVDDGGRGPDVLLALSPPLGTLVNTQLSLGSLGAQTYYVPCNRSTSGCAGSVEVTVALAAAPSQIVAISNPMALVAPSGIGDPSPDGRQRPLLRRRRAGLHPPLDRDDFERHLAGDLFDVVRRLRGGAWPAVGSRGGSSCV